MYDVAIIGAGLAGITCGQYLQQQGQKVVFLEKSRGLGGRMATRRLHSTIADHGAKFLEVQGIHTQELIANLMARGVVEPWQGMKDCYITPLGMSAIAKNLATGLDIRLNHKVDKINPTDQGWSIFFTATDLDDVSGSIAAKALIIAIPAPQALALLLPLGSLEQNPLDANYLTQLAGVEYDACITVMAGYEPEFQQALDIQNSTWQAVTFPEDSSLAWMGIDSSKRSQPPQPVVVLHSTPSFAAEHLESLDLNSLGQELLNIASPHLLPELNSPQWFQVHRWRYAQPKTFLNAPCFPAPTTSPLVCCGDWCQDRSSNNSTQNLTSNFIENALVSGLDAAQYIQS
jgi:renalase